MIFLFCIIATSIAYFKVFRVIRHHQQLVNANESEQNFGQSVIGLAKYKTSVLTISYVLRIFCFGYLVFLFIQGFFYCFSQCRK